MATETAPTTRRVAVAHDGRAGEGARRGSFVFSVGAVKRNLHFFKADFGRRICPGKPRAKAPVFLLCAGGFNRRCAKSTQGQSGNSRVFSRPRGEKATQKNRANARKTKKKHQKAQKHPQKTTKTPKNTKKTPIFFRAYARKISPNAKKKKPIPMAPPGPSNRKNSRSAGVFG